MSRRMDSRDRPGHDQHQSVLVDREGRIVYRASAPLEILQPQPGFVEQDPLALWQSVVQVIAGLRASCAVGARMRLLASPSAISARPLSHGGGPGAGSSAAGEPVGNAITWQCRRSEPVCERLRDACRNHSIHHGPPARPAAERDQVGVALRSASRVAGAGRAAANCIWARWTRGCFTT